MFSCTGGGMEVARNRWDEIAWNFSLQRRLFSFWENLWRYIDVCALLLWFEFGVFLIYVNFLSWLKVFQIARLFSIYNKNTDGVVFLGLLTSKKCHLCDVTVNINKLWTYFNRVTHSKNCIRFMKVFLKNLKHPPTAWLTHNMAL